MAAHANLYTLLQGGFPDDRQAVAIETPGCSYTWGDIEALSARMASLLTALKVPAGSRVAVQVDKSPEALILYLATLRAGLVYLPLNTAYHEAEIEYFLGDAEPAVVVCTEAARSWCEPLARHHGAQQVYTLENDGGGTLISALAGLPATFETVPRAASDLAAILYTSGTTGRSKGAMLTHGNLASKDGLNNSPAQR